MAVVEENDMQLVEREGTYELVDTKSLSAARLLEVNKLYCNGNVLGLRLNCSIPFTFIWC